MPELKPMVRMALMAVTLLLSGCSEWPNAEKFLGDLRCGMSREEVAALAKKYQAADVRCPRPSDAPDRCVIASERTFFELVFNDRGLTAVARGRYVGLYGLEVGKDQPVCAPGGQEVPRHPS